METNLIFKSLEEKLTNSKIKNFLPKIKSAILKEKYINIYNLIKSLEKHISKDGPIEKPLKPLQKLKNLRDFLWDEMHCQNWSEVPLAIRDAYSLSALLTLPIILKIHGFNIDRNDLINCLKIVDLGIIMGGELLRVDLCHIASTLSEKINLMTDKIQKLNLMADNTFSKELFSPDLDSIPKLNKTALVPSILKPDMIGFRSFLSSEQPVLLKGAVSGWPAVNPDSKHCWRSLDYLDKVAGNRTVPVEVGPHYLSDEWKTSLTLFREFLCKLLKPDDENEKVFLAQHAFLDQIPELKKDITTPDYCYMAKTSDPRNVTINAWLGPKGTVSPLHFDPKHNLYAQVAGSKYLRLLRPDTPAEMIYPHAEGIRRNSSRVFDVHNYDKNVFSEFEKAEFQEVVLEEGDLLYIPPKWWHFVKSLSASFNISFWFD